MKSELFTLEDRIWVAEKAVKEQIHDGVTYRIVDMSKLIKKIRKDRFEAGLSPFISVLPIYEDPQKERNYSIAMFYDKLNDVYYGKFLGFTSTGEPRFKRFSVRNSIDLDISREDDAEFWIVLIFFNKLQGSVTEENAYYKVYDDSQEAIKNTEKASSFLTSAGRIKSMTMKEKLYFMRYAYPGKTVASTFTESVLDGMLYEQAMKDPASFNRKYESKSRSISEVFHSALQVGVLNNIPEQGYIFEGLNVGLTEMDAITFLSKDNTILSSMLDRIGKSDTVLHGIAKSTNNVNALNKERESTSGGNKNSIHVDEGKSNDIDKEETVDKDQFL